MIFKHSLKSIIRHHKFFMSTLVPPVQIKQLQLPNGLSIIYEKLEPKAKTVNQSSPTVIYVPGFMSGKDGDKARHMRQYCYDNNIQYIRYDPTCIGESKGDWEQLNFQDWIKNAEEVINKVGSSENNIVIGSSMGGWISLWLASKSQIREKIGGLILIAPGLNFLRPQFESIYKKLPSEVQSQLDNGKVYYMDWDGYEKLAIRKAFAENSEQFEIRGEIDVKCPVRILHGVQDQSVPYQNSFELMTQLQGNDVELVFRKEEVHRFMQDESLDLLEDSLSKLLKKFL